MLERQIFKFPPDLRHAEAMRERRVQIACLLRNAAPFLRRQIVERPHVVQTVGELDEYDASILRDREQELAVILDLSFLRRVERQMTDLRQSIDDLRDLFSELSFDVRNGDIGVFDDV